MWFSAQGYALLNEKLAPDIAVLEGGYSIEKALPYMNVGIILAMAGLDYGAVREPDFDPLSLRQSDEIRRTIEAESRAVMELWKRRNELKDEVAGDARYVKRKKQIFYDTDGIREYQEETVRVCGDCGGLVMIDSIADTGNRVYAVILPRHVCPECRENGEGIYNRIHKGQYRHIYFQDKDNDIFQVKP